MEGEPRPCVKNAIYGRGYSKARCSGIGRHRRRRYFAEYPDSCVLRFGFICNPKMTAQKRAMVFRFSDYRNLYVAGGGLHIRLSHYGKEFSRAEHFLVNLVGRVWIMCSRAVRRSPSIRS
jgi:hypothetical protein